MVRAKAGRAESEICREMESSKNGTNMEYGMLQRLEKKWKSGMEIIGLLLHAAATPSGRRKSRESRKWFYCLPESSIKAMQV